MHMGHISDNKLFQSVHVGDNAETQANTYFLLPINERKYCAILNSQSVQFLVEAVF